MTGTTTTTFMSPTSDNGYYLYNRRYPNVGIAINISM